MQSPPSNCPRCEALGPFRPQQRPLNGNTIEVFIRCTTCNWELVLHESTPEIEHLRRIKARWEAYGRAARIRYGVPSSLAVAQIRKVGQRIQELEDEIAD